MANNVQRFPDTLQFAEEALIERLNHYTVPMARCRISPLILQRLLLDKKADLTSSIKYNIPQVLKDATNPIIRKRNPQITDEELS